MDPYNRYKIKPPNQNRHEQQLILKTSSEIINEAKTALSLKSLKSIMNAKAVKTNRPFTPRDSQRTLFEKRKSERPSSSVSFQNVQFKYESSSDENQKINDRFVGPTKTKLPTLVKSMTSLNKLPEDFSEVAYDHREIYSSPVPGSEFKLTVQKPEQIWFPRVSSSSTGIRNSAAKTLPLSTPLLSISSLSSPYLDRKIEREKRNWFEEENSIRDNKINEARDVLQKKMSKTNDSSRHGVQNVLSLIDKSLKGYKDEEMIALLKRLYNCLEKEEERCGVGIQLGAHRDHDLPKNIILKTIFELIHSPNEALLLHVAKIMLFLQVTDVNLATTCKLVFKISRSDKNDELFLEKNIIGSFVNCLGLATPDEDSEALIYGYGALKFLTMNLSILHCALDNGILQLMALHLKMINLAKNEGSNFPEQTSHVLFQLTGCLRNVANDESTHSKFVTSGILTALCKTTKLFISDIDLVVNVARIMSILSTKQECCEVLAEDEHCLDTLLRICRTYTPREDIIVRITYALGNVLINHDHARTKLYSSAENVSKTVLHLLKHYLDADLKLSLEQTTTTMKKFDQTSQIVSIEDVFIKVIRIVANMCINEDIGINLVSSEDTRKKMKEFLDCLLVILRRKTIHENEELVLSALGTINNLSYYSFLESKGAFQERSLDISEVLNSLLTTRHDECAVEVGRVYSNMSRSIVVRKYLLETGSLNYIVDWLESSNKDLLLVMTGVLINMMIEKEARHFLKCTKGIEKLMKNLVTVSYAERDWHLANLICQVIWNFSIEEDDLFFTLGYQQAQNLLNTLIDLLDEDKLFPNCSDSSSKLTEYKQWEDFSVVATNILEKMETRNVSD